MESPCPTPSGAWGTAIPRRGKVAGVRGKSGLGKVANVDWDEISVSESKNETIRLSGRNFTRDCHAGMPHRSESNLTWEMHNGSITFLYLAFSHVFRIYH